MPVNHQPRPLRAAEDAAVSDMRALVDLLEVLPRERGNCYGEPDSMFVDRGGFGKRAEYARRKRTCVDCPILDWCRETGRDEEHGVWGGTDPFDRGMVRVR